MKILYLVTKSEAGGAQTHVAQLCRYFKSKGNEVAVMAYPGGWLQNEVISCGGKFISNQFFSNSFNPLRAFRAMAEVKRAVAEFNPTIVHCHSSGAGVFGRLVVRNKIKTFYTAHGWGFNIGVSVLQKQLAILLEKILSRYTKKIICVSKFVKELALKNKIAREDKFQVIYNGVEIFPEKYNSTKKVKIIFVGRLADPKDPALLLKAIFDLNVEIDLVGDGPKSTELIQFIQKNNLVNVKMHGQLPREDIIELLRQSDIFSLITKWEGLPITILEAMSVGLPIVASKVGGISEIVDWQNGIVVDNKETNIRQAVEKLVDDEPLRIQMGKAGREKIKEFFSFEKMLSEVNNIYNL